MSSAEKEDNLFPGVEEKLRKLRFQNYTPRAESLKPYCDDSIDPNVTLQEMTDRLDALVRTTNSKFMDPTLDLDNLVPKKANTEMKRALNEKLERLHRKTKRAIVDIARKKQLEDGDLTGATNTQTEVSSDEEGS